MNNEQERYGFNIPTEKGIMQFMIAQEDMKACPCGHDLFDLKYRVNWISTGMIGAPPICVRAEIYLCAKCGYELSPLAHSIRESRESKLIDKGEAKP